MGKQDWRQAKAIFGEALELPAERRAAFLDQACAGDGGLRARVEGLLAADVSAGEFMGAPTAPPPPPQAQGATSGTNGMYGEAESIGERIGPYTLLGVIGEGGFGVVYAADQTGP